MATLVLDRITKSFGKVKALKDVSFDCEDGEFLVILGPSGAGKTTILNCIAGIEYPEAGTVTIDGQDVTLLPPQNRNVAMVFETYALYPQFNVYNNLAFPLRSPQFRLSEDEIEKRVTNVSELLGINRFLERLPRQLSQGQRQRVSLGRALVREPKLFLLDEPISHLDAKLRNAMRRELKLMRNNLSQTTIYVTHDFLEALSLADRVVVLVQGEVLQFDQSRTVYNHPAAMEVGKLFGELPMIFFNGKIDESGCFVDESGRFTLPTNTDLPVGKNVTLALRPTDLQLVPPESGQLQGIVYSVQYQFDKKLITISAFDYLVDVVVPPDFSISEEEKAGIYIRPEVCYFFDQETLKAI
jgi:multiple sugar transport system ATP-binding protein